MIFLNQQTFETEDKKNNDKIKLMTIHSSKGLEFPIVFCVGMEEGILPYKKAIEEGNSEEERRLCYVAITRAKSKIYVVTSIEPEELNVEGTKNLGPKIFKNYLTYVRAISNNDKKEAQFVLDKFKPVTLKGSENLSGRIEVEIKEELEKLGYTVETNLGNTNYKISIAIYDKKLDRYLLGLECDYSAFASSESILERDVYRNKFLESRGWKILRIWSRDWWLNKTKVLQKIVKTLEINRNNFIKK
jgi:hypothetical protein